MTSPEAPWIVMIDAWVAATDQRELLATAREYARTSLAGLLVTNEHRGWSIGIPMHGIKKTLSHGARPEHVRSLLVLPRLIQTAVWVGSEDNRREDQRRGIPQVHRFSARLSEGDARYAVRLVIKETSEGYKFYDHHLDTL